MNWYYLFIFFGVVIFLRFIINIYKLLRISYLFDEYNRFLKKENPKFIQHKEEVKKLFKDAGLSDSMVMHQEFLGFGQFANIQVSLFENLTNLREDVVLNVLNRFQESIGVYRKRWKESFNPIFWIDFLVKFPQHFLGYFGVLPEKFSVKILLVIYWLAALFFGLKKFNLLDILIE